jgi:hypothetical protein
MDVRCRNTKTIIKEPYMKDRALRRHQDLAAKKRRKEAYNSCIATLSDIDKDKFEDNVEKLRKVCVASHTPHDPRKIQKKPLRDLKHDITMREELRI